jgi:nucleoside-triphosphatase
LSLRVFLTGAPRVGKSTLVRKVADMIRQSGVKVGGMTSGDLRSGTDRVGFEVRNLGTGETGLLAHVNQTTGPRIGRYRVSSEDLDRIGAEAILSAIKEATLIVVDEVGPMELTSRRFKEAVQAALESGKSLLGAVHRNAQDPLVRTIKSGRSIEVIEITRENRDSLADNLIVRFMNVQRHPAQ